MSFQLNHKMLPNSYMIHHKAITFPSTIFKGYIHLNSANWACALSRKVYRNAAIKHGGHLLTFLIFKGAVCSKGESKRGGP